MKETRLTIVEQGDVRLAHLTGYMLVGDGDAVCFYIDPQERAYISASSTSPSDCPIVFLDWGDDSQSTVVEFSEFPGWRFHAGSGEKIGTFQPFQQLVRTVAVNVVGVDL